MQQIRYRVFWLLPPGDQLKLAAWTEAYETVGQLIDVAIERGRDASFIVEGDPDATAQYEGSVVLRHAGLLYAEAGIWSPTRVALKALAGVKRDDWNAGLYDGLQAEIIVKKRLRDLPGMDADHPEWGPAAGNDIVSPAQLALSINGTEAEGLFLVGFTMLFIQNGTDSRTIGTTPAKLEAFNGQGQAVGVVPDQANDRITVGNAGTYNVIAALSVQGDAGRRVTLRCRNNGVVVDGICGDVTLTSGISVLAACGQVGCAEGDALELWVEADASALLTPVSGTFAVTRI